MKRWYLKVGKKKLSSSKIIMVLKEIVEMVKSLKWFFWGIKN